MTPSETHIARARYIRTVMTWHGHTQHHLAALLGCTQVSASRKLAAKRAFTADELVLIADAYGLDPANVLRPPELEPVLGPVRPPAGDLLTCTYKALAQVRAGACSPADRFVKSSVFPQPAAA